MEDLEKGEKPRRETSEEENRKEGGRGRGSHWVPPPGPAWGSVSCSSLPHMFFRIRMSSASTPSSCHGDGTLDPVESYLRLARRRQRPACCLPLRGRPAPAAAGLLSPRGHRPPGIQAGSPAPTALREHLVCPLAGGTLSQSGGVRVAGLLTPLDPLPWVQL